MRQNAPITTPRFDVQDHGFGRIIRATLRGKLLPFGNLGGGPSLFILARLLTWRMLGRCAIALADRLPARGFSALRRRTPR